MRLYTTKHPRERFNIRWNRRKSAFRLAARGLALYIYPGPLIEWSLVILVTLTAFRLGVIYAYLERGYQARGGEYLLLLIPPIYYAAKRTLLDWIADLRRAKGRRERSAESEYTLQGVPVLRGSPGRGRAVRLQRDRRGGSGPGQHRKDHAYRPRLLCRRRPCGRKRLYRDGPRPRGKRVKEKAPDA